MTAPDREGAAVEALAERLRREFWRPENGGQWERIARAVIAAGWVPESEVREREAAAWDRGVKAHARQQLDIAYGRARQFSDPVNPYRAERIEEGE